MQSQRNRPPVQFSLGCLMLSVTLIAGCLGGYRAFVEWVHGEDEIATIDCGAGREIVITAGRYMDVNWPIYYLVRVDGEVVVPTSFIDAVDADIDPSLLKFTHVATDDGNLVGVTYADQPSRYLVIHDFSDGTSWPRDDDFEWNSDLSVDEIKEIWHRSWAELKAPLDAASAERSQEGGQD